MREVAAVEPAEALRVPRGLSGRLSDALAGQRGHLFCWAPVAFGIGIGIYFALPAEPGKQAIAACLLLAGVAGMGAIRSARWAPLLVALALCVGGLGHAALKARLAAEPVLTWRYYGPVQGRIVKIDRSQSDKVRLTLDRVVLSQVGPDRTPARVRVSLHGRQDWVEPVPGLTVMMTAHLSPPQGPVEPGGYDFQRDAWFKRLGAVGYTRSPALVWAPAEEGRAGLLVHRVRMAISRGVQSAMSGRAGAFAAAITTGDRSGMDKDTLEALRVSNLAHLLAISGLHMGLLTGFVFAAMRFAFAAWPRAALDWPTKKIAALGAMAAGAVYLALSGGSVSTERAFIMVSAMFVAVLADRRALSLRSVALAALVVLALRPEVLVSPGFQMSFAATTALIAVFGRLRDLDGWGPPWLRAVAAVILSSAVAGLATAPFAAAHFNRIAHYGLLANVLSVPLMGAWIMPAAVLSACLWPLGLSGVGLALMRPPIEWILGVADRVAMLPGSVSFVVAPSAGVIALLSLGGLFAVLWQGRGRSFGAVPVIAAFLLWNGSERPDVLVASTGGLVGVMTEKGRALSKSKGDGFAAQSWLENDGDGASQATAADRLGGPGPGHVDLALITGRGGTERAIEACLTHSVVVTSAEVEVDGPCNLFDVTRLRATGAIAIRAGANGPKIVSAREVQGSRLWTQP